MHLQFVILTYLTVLILLFAVGSYQVAPDAIRETQDHHFEQSQHNPDPRAHHFVVGTSWRWQGMFLLCSFWCCQFAGKHHLSSSCSRLCEAYV